jgi:hypothetical protein
MSTIIPEVVATPKVKSAEFIKLTINNGTTSTVYTFSSSYRAETFGGQRYTPVGGLLQIGQQNRDLRATSADTTISLSGLDPDNIYLVLGTPIRGSEVEIYRGFYTSQDILSTATVVKRFTGIVTSYNVSEEFNNEANMDIFSVSISCSSYKTVLEINVGGRRTNQDTWDYWYAGTDTSMANVSKLNGAYFDFGVPVK